MAESLEAFGLRKKAKERLAADHEDGQAIEDRIGDEADEMFPDDEDAALRYFLSRIEEIPEPHRSRVWEKMWKLKDKMPRAVRKDFYEAGTKCESGRKVREIKGRWFRW